MSKKILVTGGAGFIGSHIVDLLIREGNDVVILDNLDNQVHIDGKTPVWLNKKAKFIQGDVRNKDDLRKALQDVDVVFHEAASVGVGQSMYETNYYVSNNNLGTSNLLEFLINEEHDVKKLMIAASMSEYGEGLYECEKCGKVEPPLRTEKQMNSKEWELKCHSCGKTLKPLPTPETKNTHINNIYALTKKDQEEMCLMIGKTYGIPTVALRYFNVFGPRQSLSNPYTGVAAIFMSRIKNNNAPIIFEDGLQSRDFIFVEDIAKANVLAMKNSKANYEILNVGTGNAIAIKEIAETIAKLYKSKIKPEITYQFRKGDIRHCFADISKMKQKLGFKPDYSFEDGMKKLVEWSASVEAKDNVDKAFNELKAKGLV